MSNNKSLKCDPQLFLRLLNEVQKSIGRKPLGKKSQQFTAIQVKKTDQVLQILAGPGSGKTEVLVWRVLFELIVNGTDPAKLLVTTFTRRAATELEVRLVERSDEFLAAAHKQGLVIPDPRVHDVRIGTIHSLCDELLAEYDPKYVEKGTQLVDETEALVRMLRSHNWSLGYASAGRPPRTVNRVMRSGHLLSVFCPPWLGTRNWPSRSIQRATFLLNLIGQHTETWIPRCGTSNTPNGIEAIAPSPGLTADLVSLQDRWEQYLDQENILDFGTIQKRFTKQQHLIKGKFSHIFVDEFQDSNPIQFELHTNWLTNTDCRLTVVGDDDQAVYRFRGSDMACFTDLEPYCKKKGIRYRQEKLETNYRSTITLVEFCQEFKQQTELAKVSMPKIVRSAPHAGQGVPVRLLNGPWEDICKFVAEELDALRVGKPIDLTSKSPDSVGILMFSTSERQSRVRVHAAVQMKHELNTKNIRVYNPRAKTAAQSDSPVSQLLGLISYLIDPVTKAPAGKNGRLVEVFATHKNNAYVKFADSHPPSFNINNSHISFQKHFRKAKGSTALNSTPSNRIPILQYIDNIRTELVKANATSTTTRLSLSGLIARVLALPYFANCGFSLELFRQSLFTQLLEANIAPTRLTSASLDQPLGVKTVKGKYVWDDKFWGLLNVFGSYLSEVTLDDPEVDAFEENAVPLITFHQTKGLEFDHVYVASMGRNPDVSPALRTQLFSGRNVPFSVVGGLPETTDKKTLSLATADRDREVYVALTRAKKTLSILVPTDRANDTFARAHPGIEPLFRGVPYSNPANFPDLVIWEWKP